MRLENSKLILIREIYEEGKKVSKRMDELGLNDIPLVCEEPTNFNMKELEDNKNV